MVVSIMFYFHPYLGKISNLTNIFQMGGSTTNQLKLIHSQKLMHHLDPFDDSDPRFSKHFQWKGTFKGTLPPKRTHPLNINGWKIIFPFEMVPFLGGHGNFRGGGGVQENMFACC